MAALWYHYFLPLLVNSAVLDAHFFTAMLFLDGINIPILPSHQF